MSSCLTNRVRTRALPLRLLPVLLLACLAALPVCRGKSAGGRLADDAVIGAALNEAERSAKARVLENRRINLDGEPDLETVALIAFGEQERLAFLKGSAGAVTLLRKIDFSLSRPVHHRFTQDGGWVPSKADRSDDKKALGRFVLRVLIGRIESKRGPQSVVVEYLSEAATGGRVESHLMAFTGLQRSFQSQLALRDHPRLKGGARLAYEFTPDGKLILFPGDSGYESRLRWNGHELIVWYPGEPLFRYLPLKVRDAPEGPEYVLEIRNEGAPALLSYVSLSFPPGSQVTPVGRRPARLYRTGAGIHARSGRAMRAQGPLLELTVRAWRSLYRESLRFRVQGRADQAFVRIVSRRVDEKLISPTEKSSVPVATDQQGYPAYGISLTAARSAPKKQASELGTKEGKKQ